MDEAKASRKFEDAKTLTANLVEIRAEIERIMRDADRSSVPNLKQKRTSRRKK